jgi:dolichol-phosphate mannosyltransferase
MPRTMAMIPTYNEAENIGPLLDAILAQGPQWEALVVDDHSPDGTWKIVQERADADSRVHLLHRTTDKGRGLAGIAGFRRAIELGADWVLEMDADFSHNPSCIPAFMEASKQADLVIGSRLVPGGGEQGRSPLRGLITQFASLYIRTVLGLPVKDPTSGYRLFSRRLLEAMPWDAMHARGPEIVQEMLVAAKSRGFRMIEIPILFEERRAGQSTFNVKIMIRSFFWVLKLRLAPGGLIPR